MTHRSARITASVALVTLLLAACGTDDRGSSADVTSPVVTRPDVTSPGGEGEGWIEGEPEWDRGGSMESGAADDGAVVAAPADTEAPAEAESPVEGSGEPVANAPLRAGSVDDNADLDGYLAYLQRIAELDIPTRSFDPSGRIIATVLGSDGLPVSGEIVTVTPTVVAGAEGDATESGAIEVRTTADGQVVFLPAEHGDGTPAESYVFSVGAAAVTAAPGTMVELPLDRPGGAEAGMAVDVLFLLDVTGSMGDEIAQLKATIADVADRLATLPQAPDIRFGMTLYRDEGDLFVTSTFDLTGDVVAFQGALDDVVADGGGDTPEAVDEGFAAALVEPSWRDPATTVQLVFLVGDAAPQVGRQLQQPYTASILDATARGITVHAVAASNADDQAEVAFRHIAQGTGGRFVFLTYGAGGAATGPSTDIATTDYEELSLDDLVVRLVGEELAALTGESFVDPTPDTVPPTDPPEQ